MGFFSFLNKKEVEKPFSINLSDLDKSILKKTKTDIKKLGSIKFLNKDIKDIITSYYYYRNRYLDGNTDNIPYDSVNIYETTSSFIPDIIPHLRNLKKETSLENFKYSLEGIKYVLIYRFSPKMTLPSMKKKSKTTIPNIDVVDGIFNKLKL